MKKASLAALVGVAALATSGLAEAQSPTTTPAAVTAETAIGSATTAITAAGKSGLIAQLVLNFGFTAPGLTCPPGFTNIKYCTDGVTGGFRFIIRVIDPDPSSKHFGQSIVIGAFLSVVGAGQPFSSLTCQPPVGDATAKGCPLTIRANGAAAFTYAVAHHSLVKTQLIAHIRPKGTTTSTEVIQFLNL